MLTELPKVGEHVRAKNHLCQGDLERFCTKGRVYKIEGVDSTGSPFFISDSGAICHIGRRMAKHFELCPEYVCKKTVENTPNSDIQIAGLSVSAWDYEINSANFAFDFTLEADSPKNTLDVISEFQKDITKLIKEKYSQ